MEAWASFEFSENVRKRGADEGARQDTASGAARAASAVLCRNLRRETPPADADGFPVVGSC